MGLPKGTNNGNHGAKGKSGRKSAYQKMADIGLLWELWTKKVDQNELAKKIKSEKYTLQDVFLMKALQGNDRFLNAIFNKIYPDKLMSQTRVNTAEPIHIILDELEKD